MGRQQAHHDPGGPNRFLINQHGPGWSRIGVRCPSNGRDRRAMPSNLNYRSGALTGSVPTVLTSQSDEVGC
eukprot:974269-Rhodomonas_salina.1